MPITTGVGDTKTPGVFFSIDPTQASGGSNDKETLLVMGQRLATGTTATGEIVRVVSDSDADEKFGVGSMLAQMCKIAAAPHGYGEMYAIAADDDGAAVAAAGTLTVGGSATAAGTISVMIGGERVRVAVAVGDAPADIAAALVLAINANVYLPVTAAAADGVVTLTARHKGEASNEIFLGHSYYTGEKLPAGVTLTIVGMTGGTGNPDIEPIIDAMAAVSYDHVLCAWSDAANLTALHDEFEVRWGPFQQIDGWAFVGKRGTSAQMGTFVGSMNSPYIVVVSAEPELPAVPWEVAAALAGRAVYALGDDPARGLTGLSLTGVLPPKPTKRYTRDERDVMLWDGVSTNYIDPNGNVCVERVVTTYTQNSMGVADDALSDLCTVATVRRIRREVVADLSTRYARCKLVSDTATANFTEKTVRPKDIKASIITKMGELESLGLVQNVAEWKDDILVEIDAEDKSRVNIYLPPEIVGQARVFAGVIAYRK